MDVYFAFPSMKDWVILPIKVMTELTSYVVRVEKVMAPHSSTLTWEIPWTEEPGRLQSMGLPRVGDDWATSLSLFTFTHWRRQWQPTRVPAWKIPWTGEPGGLPSMGSHRVGHDWSDLAAAAAATVGGFMVPSWSDKKYSKVDYGNDCTLSVTVLKTVESC